MAAQLPDNTSNWAWTSPRACVLGDRQLGRRAVVEDRGRLTSKRVVAQSTSHMILLHSCLANKLGTKRSTGVGGVMLWDIDR